MSKLYFYYSAMNAGKTTVLLQSSYNYRERGMNTAIYTAEIDDRFFQGKICSRIGISAPALLFNDRTNFFKEISNMHNKLIIHCVFIDECHFLNKLQVIELTNIVDELNIPVLCYGLRTDFRAELFSGSLWLLAWADKLVELKTICHCGRQANRVLRLDHDGQVVSEGKQILVGNNLYVSVCRLHFIKNQIG